MKYFSIETAQNNGNVERIGRITFADKYRGNGNGFAYLKCNGRKVYIPYTELDEKTIKALHVSCPVSFKLATDGKFVWAVDLKVMPHYDRDLKNLYTDLHDWPCEPIKVNSIKKILIVNKYYDLSQPLQIESDNKHISRKLYEAVQIITIDSEYLIYSKNSPIKGNYYHVDNIYDFMEYTLQKLGVGPYEPIENELVSRERLSKEKAYKEEAKILKESMKKDFIIQTRNIISHPSCTKKVFIFSYGSLYTVSTIDGQSLCNQIMSYYNITKEDFYELIKKYNGYIEDNILLFKTLGEANGFGKALLMNEILNRLKEKYNS